MLARGCRRAIRFAMKPVSAHRLAFSFLAPMVLAACATAPAPAPLHSATQAAATPAATDLAVLVREIDIPFESFTLANGLTTIVHTDRKAPIVGVTVYYRVGSKHEARGRTGFAHLFEHLMFGGSENVANFDVPLEAAGSTPTNGSTWYDRTNYVETVPTGALDLALFMESDRMGHLLGAVTQDKLDAERGVVQNEKRQGDTQPYALADYLTNDALLPVGHPYRHATIGSMADLEAASLADVHRWFRDNYGPNNVVLVLAGDIDAASARPMVERWFGHIPRGPEVARVDAGPVTLPAPVELVTTDAVPLTRISRVWTGPGYADPDIPALQVGLSILGGLNSSRLDNALVRGTGQADSVMAWAEIHEQLSFLNARVNVADGVPREDAQAALEAEIARLLAEGPSPAELARAQTQFIAGAVGALEAVGGFGGKGVILAEGLLYAGDAAFYRQDLQRIAALTPAQVQAALQRWLARPPLTISVVPGERTLDGAELGGWGDDGPLTPAAAAPPPDPAPPPVIASGPPREAPPIAPVGALAFPEVETARLANGVEVLLARRTAVPQVTLAMSFAGGSAVDPADRAGLHETMVALLAEGTTTRTATQIAEEQEDLGSQLGASAGVDADTVYLTTLTANLAPSLDLLADVVRNPAFREEDVERVREQRLAGIAAELADPEALANRTFLPLLYGADHPYAHAATGGDPAVVAGLTVAELAAEHARWLRPDNARIVAVGDITMPQLLAALEASLGDWQAPATPLPASGIAAQAPAPQARLVLVDRPDSPSSTLLIGRITPLFGHAPGIEAVELANEVIGGGFLARLNADLRATRGWTYGVGSGLPGYTGQRHFRVATQVQADRTGDAIAVIRDQLAAFPATRPVDAVELQRVTDGNVRGLPNRFETNAQVLGALVANQLFGRDARYQAGLPAIYRSADAAVLDQAAARYLQPDGLTIVVVGDRQVVEPQLQALGLPLEILEPVAKP